MFLPAFTGWFLREDNGVHQVFFLSTPGKIGCPLVATSCEQPYDWPYVTILYSQCTVQSKLSHVFSLLGHLTCSKYQQVHVIRHVTLVLEQSCVTIMLKRFLKKMFLVFLRSFGTKKRSSKVTCTANHGNFSETFVERIGFRGWKYHSQSSLRIPENMGAHS